MVQPVRGAEAGIWSGEDGGGFLSGPRTKLVSHVHTSLLLTQFECCSKRKVLLPAVSGVFRGGMGNVTYSIRLRGLRHLDTEIWQLVAIEELLRFPRRTAACPLSSW